MVDEGFQHQVDRHTAQLQHTTVSSIPREVLMISK